MPGLLARKVLWRIPIKPCVGSEKGACKPWGMDCHGAEVQCRAPKAPVEFKIYGWLTKETHNTRQYTTLYYKFTSYNTTSELMLQASMAWEDGGN